MKISNYKLFNESRIEKLFESIINESIVYYSPRLREMLSKFKNSEIAQALLDAETKEIKDDMTLIDLDETKPDYLTFIRTSKAIKNLESDDNLYTVLKDPFSTKHSPIAVINHFFSNNKGNILTKDRNPIKTTRIIPKILSNKFTPPQVDDFARKLSAKISKEDRHFKVVEGDDIAFWYNSKNYAELDGSLGSSCMRNSPSYFFDIYTKNPDVCKLVILLDDNNQLLGRALLWKITSHSPKVADELFFMDRQYTIDPTDVEHFREYAKKNGWSYKEYNSIGNTRNLIYNDERYIVSMEIKVEDSYDYYPYMDTFKRYRPDNETLYNDANDSSENGGDYILEQTDGSYTEVDEGVYSEYENRTIPDGEEVWSDEVNSYLTRDDAIRVITGSNRYRGWYPEGYDDLVYDEWIDEYIHINNAVYSDWYDNYIYEDNATRGITDVDSDGEPMNIYDIYDSDGDFISYSNYMANPWYKRLSQEYEEWVDISYLYSGCLFRNYDNRYSLVRFKIELFEISELSDKAKEIGFQVSDFISKIDAEILNCTIKDVKYYFDQFDYHNNFIEEKLQNYYTYLIQREKELSSILSKKQTMIEFEDNDQYLDKVRKLYDHIVKRSNEIKDLTYNNNVEIK